MNYIVQRTHDGEVIANVRHIPHHSPAGFGCGYGGSGPADLALAILQDYFETIGYKGEKIKLWNNGECFSVAWQLHQSFKAQFIATMPEQGGEISFDQVKQWVRENM